MSDIFGIGSAMKAMSMIYFQSARASGRTTQMVESLKDGDRVVFSDSREAKRVDRMIHERGLTKVRCITVPVHEPQRVFENGTSQGRTIFDHRWVQDFYEMRIKSIGDDIHYFQRESSGFGEAHLETRRETEEISKWMQFNNGER